MTNTVVGETAVAEFAYLQKIAAETWGAEPTAHFARVLRDARVSPKRKDGCRWAQAVRKVGNLPEDWQGKLLQHIALSMKGQSVLGKTIWSATYTHAVLAALSRWVRYCAATGCAREPTATSLQGYGSALLDPTGDQTGVTVSTAGDYLQRIMAGLDLVTEGRACTEACAFVVRDWRERASCAGTSTKSGDQLIGARTLYNFGFHLIDKAKTQRMRGIGAATTYRNGLIFAIGTALPERARALTWLEFDRSLTLIDDTHLHIYLPGAALKLPEARKATESFDVIFENRRLVEALRDYRRSFRPLFDDGDMLFPSVHGKPGAISSGHLGRLTGDITEREFQVRIPIHRLRDNVATEASENLLGGGYASKTLLRHIDERTTRRHYDRSEGIKATIEYGESIERKCTVEAVLNL